MLKRHLPHTLLLTLLLCTGGLALMAQDSLSTTLAPTDSLGQWRSLQSYTSGRYVTQSPNSIIYSTDRAIFYLDKEDGSFSKLAKDDGLAEARIRLIRYHEPTGTLIIVYESTVIDLLRDGQFTTLRQIDNFNFNGDKSINSLHFGQNDVVYFSTGFGVTALDLNTETFLFTTFTGVPANATAEFDGFLYTATEEGLYRVRRNGVNVNDFGNWQLLSSDFGLPGDYTATVVNVWRDQLFLGVNEDLYILRDGRPVLFFDEDQARALRLSYLSPGPEHLLIGYRCTDDGCFSSQVLVATEDAIVRQLGSNCAFRANYAIEDDRGRFWFGEDQPVEGVRFLESLSAAECETLEFPGPPQDENFRLLHDGTSLWVAPSVLDENFSPGFSFQGPYRFRDGSWTGFNRDNTAAFLGQNGVRGGDDDVASIIDVYYDAVNDLHWFSSFFEGVIAFDEETETGTLYDESNSALKLSVGAGPGRVRVSGAVTDPQGFTYLANNRAENDNIVSVRSPDNQWANLGTTCGINRALNIELDDNGYVWVIHASSVDGGITVIDPAGTPLDPSDDRCRTITTSNSRLPTNTVRSIAKDLDGTMWVGTDQGVILFECGATVFDSETCLGRRPVATADDFGGFLLETESIIAITVDGGNRKWIGTNGGGTYLLSPNGEEQLVNFDAGNSPLLDNVVRDIAINPSNGVVYFGTELGIISYRATATSATRAFRENLTIFPNPVEPGYDGPVAIQGLARDARVKITDVSGKLVAEGNATGGQFVWDGADYTGRRVQTGVYLVFAASNVRFSGPDPGSAVGKIVFVR